MSWEKYLQEKKDRDRKLEELHRSVQKEIDGYKHFAKSVRFVLQKCGNISHQKAMVISILFAIISFASIFFTKEDWLTYLCFVLTMIGFGCSFILAMYGWIMEDFDEL